MHVVPSIFLFLAWLFVVHFALICFSVFVSYIRIDFVWKNKQSNTNNKITTTTKNIQQRKTQQIKKKCQKMMWRIIYQIDTNKVA